MCEAELEKAEQPREEKLNSSESGRPHLFLFDRPPEITVGAEDDRQALIDDSDDLTPAFEQALEELSARKASS